MQILSYGLSSYEPRGTQYYCGNFCSDSGPRQMKCCCQFVLLLHIQVYRIHDCARFLDNFSLKFNFGLHASFGSISLFQFRHQPNTALSLSLSNVCFFCHYTELNQPPPVMHRQCSLWCFFTFGDQFRCCRRPYFCRYYPDLFGQFS